MDTSIEKYSDKIIGIDIDYNTMFGIDVLSNIDFSTVDLSKTVVQVDAPGIDKKIWMSWIAGEDVLLWWKGDTWGAAHRESRGERWAKAEASRALLRG